MSSNMRSVTAQAALLNVISVISAQLITQYRGQGLFVTSSTSNPLGLELIPIIQFLFLTCIITPPNVLWQQFLESQFPGYPASKDNRKLKVDDDGEGIVIEKKLNVANTAIKFIFDQTVGSWVNTAAFLIGITAVRGGGVVDCLNAVNSDFWSLQRDSYKLWPIVSILNFLIVPPAKRVVVGATVGLFWNIYMVLRVS